MNARSLALRVSSPTMLLVISLIAAGSTVNDARAQWVQTAGPYGGTVSAMAVLRANTSHPMLFAGTASGIFRSSDSGAQWVNVTAGLANTSVSSLIVMDTDIFAMTSGGVLRSTNGGTVWRFVNNGLSGNTVDVMGVMGTMLFADYSYGSGIFRSTNRGASWIQVDSSLPNGSGATAFAAIGTVLFAGSYSGLFRSNDSGKSWTTDTSGLSPYPGVLSFAVMGSSIFVGTDNGINGIFLSTDSGTTWTPASSGNEGYAVLSLVANGSILYSGGDYGFFQSSNQGQTWTSANSGLNSIEVEAIAVLDTARAGIPATLFAGTFSFGIFESTNGGVNWLPANTGLLIANVTTFAALGPDVFAGTNNSLFRSSDDGGSWQPLSLYSFTQNNGVTALATDGQALFAAPQYSSGILVSTDSGTTWINPNSGNNSTAIVSALFLDVGSSGTTLFAATSAGIFQSPDEGTTWIDASSGLLVSNLSVYSFAQGNSNLYCGTASGGIFYSSDGGKTWNDISPNTTASQLSNVQALAVSGTTIFAGMSYPYGGGGVLQSTDNGMNWNTEDGTANVAALLAIGKNVFAATDAGISLSTNAGITWSDAGEGMNGAAVNALAIRGPYLYAGTTGAGVWRRPLAEMIDVSSVAPNTPLAAAQGNYPNPFTSQTTIPFSLSHSGHVTVKIFDMLGNEIATLANQDMGAGPHEAVWNAGAATPGMYACQIATSEGIRTLPLLHGTASGH